MDAVTSTATSVSTATATSAGSGIDAGTIADIAKGILGVASGGVGSWIAAGVLIILAGLLAWWINKKIKDLQNQANDKNRETDQAETDPVSHEGETKWDNAAEKSEQERKDNPDDGKKPLDPVE